MNAHIKDVLERVILTFIEAFGASWALTNFSMNKVAVVSAGAAGLSAVINLARKYIQLTK